jgi:hypothetical protein
MQICQTLSAYLAGGELANNRHRKVPLELIELIV